MRLLTIVSRVHRCQSAASCAGLVVMLAAGAWMLVSSPGAGAKVSKYSYKDKNCTRHNTEDPINVIWYGRRQLLGGIETDAVMNYMNGSPFQWTNHDGGLSYIAGRSTRSGPQVCNIAAGQNANDKDYADGRDHLRAWEDPQDNGDPRTTHYAASDAHHDQNVYLDDNCRLNTGTFIKPAVKHITTDYNGPAQSIAKQISAGGSARRHYSWVPGGNTQKQRQCDGSQVRSDGNVLWVHLKSGD